MKTSFKPVQNEGRSELSLQAVLVSFAAGRRLIVDGVDLTPVPGQVTGLIGPNGAGKSTLLRMMARLLSATKGKITLLGDELNKLHPQTIAQRLAYMAQHASADQGFTVLDMVLMGRYAHDPGWRESFKDVQLAYEALERTGCRHLAGRRYGTLSGGERQRVMLARALVQQTDVLLLDEPTASLDLKHQLAVFELVRRLTQEQTLTTIAVVHDLTLAARYCDRLCLLHKGRVAAVGEPEDVLHPNHLRAVFEVEVVVERHPTLGLVQVIPLSAGEAVGGGATEETAVEGYA